MPPRARGCHAAGPVARRRGVHACRLSRRSDVELLSAHAGGSTNPRFNPTAVALVGLHGSPSEHVGDRAVKAPQGTTCGIAWLLLTPTTAYSVSALGYSRMKSLASV